MSEELVIRQGAPTLAGIKTGSLFPCHYDDREELLADMRGQLKQGDPSRISARLRQELHVLFRKKKRNT